jgi:hypothetical protein
MRRVIVMLLACVLMLSHGGMGEAAPHANGEHHASTVHVEHTDTADHHLAPASPERDGGMDHASHVHVVGDLVAPQTASVPPFPVSGSVVRMTSDTVLHSRGVPPLLEPPAA